MMHQVYTRPHQFPEGLQADLIQWQHKLLLDDAAYNWIEVWAQPIALFVGFDGDQWVSAVELYHELVSVGTQGVPVFGISGVITLPEYRGRGLAGKLIDQALRYGRDRWQVDFGLLTRKPKLIPYYARLGWRLAEGDVTFQYESARASFDPELVVPMAYSFDGAEFPTGQINIIGHPW